MRSQLVILRVADGPRGISSFVGEYRDPNVALALACAPITRNNIHKSPHSDTRGIREITIAHRHAIGSYECTFRAARVVFRISPTGRAREGDSGRRYLSARGISKRGWERRRGRERERKRETGVGTPPSSRSVTAQAAARAIRRVAAREQERRRERRAT